MYIGIAGNLSPNKNSVEVGFSIHDATYSIDFSVKHIHPPPNKQLDGAMIADFIIETIQEFSKGICLLCVRFGNARLTPA
jgi:hypothetical protein